MCAVLNLSMERSIFLRWGEPGMASKGLREIIVIYINFRNLCKNFAVCQTQSQPNPDSNRNLGRIIELKKLFMFDLRISIINK